MMARPGPTRLALIGAGVMGRRHLKAIASVEGVELVAIVDENQEAEGLATERGARFWSSAGEMLGREEPDGVIVSTPTDRHLDPALQALRAGAHVLVEKPLTATMAEARAVIDLAEQVSRHVLVGHHRRYYGCVQKTREMVREGVLGELVGVSGQWTVRKADAYFDPDWRQVRAAGPVLTNLIHEIDTLRFICGEIVSISARTRSGLRGHSKEEAAAVLMEFEGGALGTFLLSDATPSPWTWEQATGENPAFPKAGRNTCRFVGSKAALEFPNLVLWRHADDGRDWRDELTPTPMSLEFGDAFAAQCAHFRDVIAGLDEPRVSAADAAGSLAAALSVFEAAESGAHVQP